MENTKKLSVIIVNYKSEHYLERCLSSLQATLSGIDAEIIIVNNSPQESLEKIKSLFPQIIIINNSQNGGFGQGNNVGASQAEGEYLLFLNPDTEIIVSDFGAILEEFKKDKNLGALGGKLITEENKIQEWSAGIEVSFWDILKNNIGLLGSRQIWESEKPKEAAWVAGTAMIIRRELFLELGGFDENIFMYFEDVDLCQRIRKLGKKVYYYPAFKVLHKCGGSYEGENKKRQKEHYYDSMEYYFQKHRPKWETAAIKIIRKIFFN